MNIKDDVLTFEAVDFDGLSDFAKKALPLYVGEKLEFQNVLADTLNVHIEAAKKALTVQKTIEPDVQSLLKKLAAADQKKLDDAAPLLAQLDSVLS